MISLKAFLILGIFVTANEAKLPPVEHVISAASTLLQRTLGLYFTHSAPTSPHLAMLNKQIGQIEKLLEHNLADRESLRSYYSAYANLLVDLAADDPNPPVKFIPEEINLIQDLVLTKQSTLHRKLLIFFRSYQQLIKKRKLLLKKQRQEYAGYEALWGYYEAEIENISKAITEITNGPKIYKKGVKAYFQNLHSELVDLSFRLTEVEISNN